LVQFSGEGHPSVGFGDYLEILFVSGSDNPNRPLNRDTLLWADFSPRLPNSSRHPPVLRVNNQLRRLEAAFSLLEAAFSLVERLL
jgi:hypothetical protein